MLQKDIRDLLLYSAPHQVQRTNFTGYFTFGQARLLALQPMSAFRALMM